MKEIKVGEYVRTKQGNIFKIIGGNIDDYYIDIDYSKLEYTEEDWFESNRHNDNGYFFDEEHIVKHSKDIIDLIEEGDYVNGKEVVYDADASEMYNGHKTIDVSISNDNSTTWTILDTEIRDIVTKQQFNQMKYIVGE